MSDASERIIILSAVVLVIILWIPNSGLIQTIVTIDDLEIEIVTSRDNYTLEENFTANVYLVNTRSRDVWMEPIISIPFTGSSKSDLAGTLPHVFINVMDGRLRISAKTKVLLIDRLFTPTKPGEFIITCLGARKTVRILEPLKLGQGIGPLIMDYRDPEVALSHGFKGYVNISYVSEMPPRVIVSPGKVINYTIRLELIPHVPEFMETEVVLDPENSNQRGAGWGQPVPVFNVYIRYSPNGSILLHVDEPRNVTMILSVPDGFNGMSATPDRLIGVGIMADVPVASAYGASLDRITRDEG